MAVLTQSLMSAGDPDAAKNFIGETIFAAGPSADEVWFPSHLIVCLSDGGFAIGAYGGIPGGLTTGIKILIVDDNGIVDDITDPAPIKINEHLATLGSSSLIGVMGVDAIMQVLVPLDGVQLSGAVGAQVIAVFEDDDLSPLSYHEFRLVGTKGPRRP